MGTIFDFVHVEGKAPSSNILLNHFIRIEYIEYREYSSSTPVSTQTIIPQSPTLHHTEYLMELHLHQLSKPQTASEGRQGSSINFLNPNFLNIMEGRLDSLVV